MVMLVVAALILLVTKPDAKEIPESSVFKAGIVSAVALFGLAWLTDTFIVRWRDRSLNADAFVNFALTPDGKVREVRMEAISPLTDFSFDFQDLLLTPVAAAS